MTKKKKNVYINKLDDIINKYNNTYHRAIKIKPIDVKDVTHVDFIKEFDDEYLKLMINLKLVVMSEFQNTKYFY